MKNLNSIEIRKNIFSYGLGQRLAKLVQHCSSFIQWESKCLIFYCSRGGGGQKGAFVWISIVIAYQCDMQYYLFICVSISMESKYSYGCRLIWSVHIYIMYTDCIAHAKRLTTVIHYFYIILINKVFGELSHYLNFLYLVSRFFIDWRETIRLMIECIVMWLS